MRGANLAKAITAEAVPLWMIGTGRGLVIFNLFPLRIYPAPPVVALTSLLFHNEKVKLQLDCVVGFCHAHGCGVGPSYLV